MATPRRAILIFGRFQPPTKGHERLFKAADIKAAQQNATVYVFPSLTHGDGRNPLSYEQKVRLLTPALRTMSRVQVGPKTVTNPAVALTWAKEQGFRDVLMYVGDDRLLAFRQLARSWSRAQDPLGTVKVVISSMPRTGAWDASKVSGTAAKAAARANDVKAFQSIVISRATAADVTDAMKTIQRITEEWDMELDIDFGHPPLLTEEDAALTGTLHAVFETEDEDDEDDPREDSAADAADSDKEDSSVVVFDDDEDASLIHTLPAVFETDDDAETSSETTESSADEDDDFVGTLHAVFETDEDPAVKDETLGAVRPRVVEPPNTEVIAYPQSGVSVEVEPPLANNGGRVPSDTEKEKSFVVISPKRHLKHDMGVKAQTQIDQTKNAK